MSDASPDLKHLQQQTPLCLSRDRYRLSRQVQTISERQKRQQPVDQDLQKLGNAIERSRAAVQARKDSLPLLEYPDLPVSQRRDDIVAAIRQHQVVIIAGETGSGKTTQIPKMCIEAGLGLTGFIGHTQPRRLAARSVAQRIADELKSPLGQQVGYKIRFQDQLGEHSLIKLMTDGILLAEIPNDRFLNQYDCIIIDEAHERSLNIDFLLGYLRQLLPKRPDLKVIITSATIDHWRFSRHFNDAPVIEVEGRTYPVEVLYRPLQSEGSSDEEQVADDEGQIETGILQAVNEIVQLERSQPNPRRPGDILVFLSGEREIRQVAERLRKHGPKHTEILPLYSRLSNSEQNRIFQSHTGRRIVLSTNVAETSITVPNIGYVIDTGLARISRYSYRSKVQRLPIEAISQASANQRKGRCGRVAEGICIRLYDETDFINRPEFTEPEILRTNLASVILQMQGLRLGDVNRFPFIDPPDSRLINDGYRLLEELGAVDRKRQITALGMELVKLPVDPRIGRMIIAARQFHCLKEMLIIASGMSVQDPWQRPHDRQGAADESLRRFQHEDSDFLTYCNVWQESEKQKEELSNNRYRRWLLERFLSYLRMREWQDLYRQLKQICHELGWTENQEPARYEEMHKAILAGLLGHVAVKDEQKGYQAARNRMVQIFPASTCHSRKPKWIMAAEIVETAKVYARTVARIEPQWIEDVGGDQLKKSWFEPHWEKKAACVMANEQSSLFGLIINPRKRVNYSTIDPVRCRELFIQHALVAGEYETRAPYARHNRELIESLEYLESKSRRRDILVDDLTIFGLFDAIVPADVVNGASFEHWRKKAEQKNPQILFLQREQLLQPRADEVSENSFPDQVKLEGGKIRIDYQFEPGKSQDGLNIVTPLTLINQVSEEQLEWLVPGLEKDKVIALIKSLPKSLRKHFVPAPDFAAAFLQTQPNRQQSLKVQLTDFLRQHKRVDLKPEDFDESSLPLYLLANLRVLDDKGKMLAEGRDIRLIKQSLQADFQASLKNLTATELNQERYDHWAFDAIPEVYETRKGGALIKAFPALVDEGEGVRLQLFDTAYAARQSMQKGLLRLFILALPQQVRYLKKQHQLPEKVALRYAPFGDRKELADGLVESAFNLAFIANQPLLWNRQAFEQRLQQGRHQLVQAAQQVEQLITSILQRHHDILFQINSEKSPARQDAIVDIRFQLEQLFPPHWLQCIAFERLQQYPRYLDGILMRFKRLQGNIERDHQFTRELDRLWQQYRQRKAKHDKDGVLDEALDNWRWALEEYRISVFAQGMKTAYPVSMQRLEKLWQSVAA
ncbi:MAG: ATP-dependent RNA helicase HrpA [Gammaproteobacteria bacterium]